MDPFQYANLALPDPLGPFRTPPKDRVILPKECSNYVPTILYQEQGLKKTSFLLKKPSDVTLGYNVLKGPKLETLVSRSLDGWSHI